MSEHLLLHQWSGLWMKRVYQWHIMHFQATSPRDCFEEALYGCLALVYTHRHTEWHKCTHHIWYYHVHSIRLTSIDLQWHTKQTWKWYDRSKDNYMGNFDSHECKMWQRSRIHTHITREVSWSLADNILASIIMHWASPMIATCMHGWARELFFIRLGLPVLHNSQTITQDEIHKLLDRSTRELHGQRLREQSSERTRADT